MRNLILIFSILMITACTTQKVVEHKVIQPAIFAKNIQQNSIQLVDVRTPEEFDAGHIEGAQNIDYYNENFSAQANELDKNQPVYLYCRSGKRSSDAAKQLKELGFEQVYELEGGILAWPEEDLTQNNK